MSRTAPPFRVKICGVRRLEDVYAAAEAGADAVGFNFYLRSPRCVTAEEAAPLAAALPAGVQKVGVFVNATAEEVLTAARVAGLSGVQLHGDEPPELLAEVRRRAPRGALLIRAFRVHGLEGLAAVESYLEACRSLGATPDLMLLDAFQPGAYGGTGAVLDWAALAAWRPLRPTPPLVLAGGLVAENVGEAIRTVRPAAVDAASGVESAPGVKDRAKAAAFAAAALHAFSSLR